MELTIEQLALIEKYCSVGLTEAEKTVLENIPNWEKAVAFQQNFLQSFEVFKIEELKEELQSYEADFQYTNAQSSYKENILEKWKQKLTLLADEISFLFQPVPHYQANLAMANRSGNLRVENPLAGFDAVEDSLHFKLQKTPSHELQLSIENNLQEILISKIISPKQGKSFTVSLERLQGIPGRYYWRLAMNREVVMGEFFIRKELFA